MIRIIKTNCRQIGFETFVDRLNTKDFNLPELEAHLKDISTGAFVGIEIIENEVLKEGQK